MDLSSHVTVVAVLWKNCNVLPMFVSYLLVSDAPAVKSVAFCFSTETLLESPMLSVNVN